MNTESELAIDQRPWPGLDVRGAHILVAGFGVSGFAVADQTLQRGARVTVVDGNDSEEQREKARILTEAYGLDARLGPGTTDSLPDDAQFDLVVTSPGWRADQPLLAQARERGIPVWSEVELARRMQAVDGPVWLGITGTNGKTTVVTMLESILRAAGLRAAACGNVGLPVIEAALDPEGFDVLAVELSSFQLEWTEHLLCDSAVVLNISEDHLDWHGSLERYAQAKGRIYEGMARACVYNVHDEATRTLVENADVHEGARAIGITLGAPGLSELGVVDGLLVDRAFIEQRRTQAAELASFTDLAHLGAGDVPAPHTVLNALAAAALARSVGVPQAAVRDGLRAMSPGEHRYVPVATIDGVTYVNDSKATNPDATKAALRGADSIVWIAGGLTKGADVRDVIRTAASRLRAVVLIGEDADPYLRALSELAADVPVERIAPGGTNTAEGRFDLMARAVAAAQHHARPGDIVLLAPAAASMDQFRNYAERGDLFAQAVRECESAQS